jgi:PAS domain S-box-containing protein
MGQNDNQIAKDKAAQAMIDASEAEQKSHQALQDANTAIHKAGKAENIAKTAKDPSEFALREAKEAMELGEKARIEAEEARSKAEFARSEAEGARGKAEQARSLAEEMRTKAEAARSTTETERIRSDEARQFAKEARFKAEQALQIAIEAQEQAKKAEERYRLVIEGTDDGLWDWDIEKGTIYWNGRFFQMLGMDHTMVPPTEADLLECVHPDDRQRLRDTIQSALKRPEHFAEIFRMRYLNGHYIHCCMRGKTLLNEQGKAIRMAGMITDISERIENQEKLAEYSSRLEQSNRDLEQFAAIASHDLQAPLRKVKAFAENLEKAAKDNLEPESLDDLRRMHRSLSNMQRLIDDLLTFSKVIEGDKLLSIEPVDFSRVLARAQVDLEDQIKEKRAKIEIGPLCQIKGDENLLIQLFQNLLQNALKYQSLDRSPQISISANSSENGFCEISVQDNGIGFEPKDAERIFGIFERLHNKSIYSGTGIGLAICRRIAERHKGSIRAESKPEEGSRFIVQLPLS